MNFARSLLIGTIDSRTFHLHVSEIVVVTEPIGHISKGICKSWIQSPIQLYIVTGAILQPN